MRIQPSAPNRATDIHPLNCKYCNQPKSQLAVNQILVYILAVITVPCLAAVFMQNGHIRMTLKMKDMLEIQTEIDKPLVPHYIQPKCLP